MPEKDFQREVLDRLIRIETKQDDVIKIVDSHSETVKQHDKEIVRIDASTRSAHHRIDGIFWGAGVLGTLAGGLGNIVVSLLLKVGGRN